MRSPDILACGALHSITQVAAGRSRCAG